MGGLIGWVDFARDLTREPGVVQGMTEILRQRGAQEGTVLVQRHYAFGGRGVADARPGDDGQPFRLDVPDGQVIALHTGAIHNSQDVREELAAKGAACTGASDGELLARAYLQWGEDCVTQCICSTPPKRRCASPEAPLPSSSTAERRSTISLPSALETLRRFRAGS
ncbi:MAG: hypothetical protein ACXIVE_13395, partial [Salinarimonas sp.]